MYEVDHVAKSDGSTCPIGMFENIVHWRSGSIKTDGFPLTFIDNHVLDSVFKTAVTAIAIENDINGYNSISSRGDEGTISVEVT